MTVFMSVATYIGRPNDDRRRSLISNVHAETSVVAENSDLFPTSLASPDAAESRAKPPVAGPPSLSSPAERFTVTFQKQTFILPPEVQDDLLRFVHEELQAIPAMQVRILTEKSVKNGANGIPQYNKLRAQHVARAILPYTQAIEIQSVELEQSDSVIVEVYPPNLPEA